IDHSNGDIYYLSGYYIYKNGAKFWNKPAGWDVNKLLVSSGNVYCVMGDSYWKYSLYNANTGEKIADIGTDMSKCYFRAANISPDGKKIGVVLRGDNAFGDGVGLVSIYDVESGSLKETIMEEKEPGVGLGCAFDNNGNFYYAASTPYINGEWAYYHFNIHKNDQVLYTIKESDYYYDGNMKVPIIVSGKDIYFAIFYGNDKYTIGVFKNGSHQYDIKVARYPDPTAIRISSKGNLYVATGKDIFRDGKNVYTLELQNKVIQDFDIYE
ncbi:MAG: hypothetical protein HUJ90_05705, partial [Bacteroidales bacterium]|nr:hypothetical protein [Bacteroidales bacterium]